MPGREVIGREELQEVMEVMERGVLTRYGFDQQRNGVFKVKEFEKAFAVFCGTRRALGVANGSSSLKTALEALDVGPGDEVIVPAFTFVATYAAVLEVGALPVVADIDDTFNLDPEKIEQCLSPRTKAIIPVHMCGAPARIQRIIEVARKRKLLVLEDAAQCCGGTLGGRKVGSFGDMGAFSFDFVKTITTGEGGMVVTDDESLYLRADQYHDQGHVHDPSLPRALEKHDLIGFNYRMGELQGAIGLAQLRKIDDIINAQRANKARIKALLREIEGIAFRGMVDPQGDTATFLAFTFPGYAEAKRFQQAASPHGLDTTLFKDNAWHYVLNWEHFLSKATVNSKQYPFSSSVFKDRWKVTADMIPYADDILGRTLFTGVPVKMTDEQFEKIAGAVRKASAVL
ncbi:MAG: DegT/DnrJ/EryC1/StrS family aminotransferase [Deltaproteobacteria bacterium]|nr:DegT/DnrJ/EryC1/StrS family aminotransferase [Deltaproteobacteria bacterium]